MQSDSSRRHVLRLGAAAAAAALLPVPGLALTDAGARKLIDRCEGRSEMDLSSLVKRNGS